MSEDCNPLAEPGVFVAKWCHAQAPIAVYAERLRECRSVRQCYLVWHFLASYIGERVHNTHYNSPLFGVSAADLRKGLSSLYYTASTRSRHWAESDTWAWSNVGFIADALRPDKAALDEYGSGKPLPAAETAVLVHFATDSKKAEREVQPFVDLLHCFATRQGMRFVYDRAPHMRFPWVQWRSGSTLATAYVLGAASFTVAPSSMANGSTVFSRLLRRWGHGTSNEALLLRLSGDYLWGQVDEHLGVISGNPARWAKVLSIAEALEKHEALLYFDYDVTIRPDCLGASRPLQELFAADAENGNAVPHVVVRDAPYGVDCLNSGFLAIRRTPVARVLLRMWKAKMMWPGVMHGDQGALAETLLELLDIEHRMLSASEGTWDFQSVPGYNHQCASFLFPDARGIISWMDYCECFQYHLIKMVGNFGERKSLFVRFLDPRRVDVNFVPNSFLPSHSQNLQRMRLLPWQPGLPTSRAISRPAGGVIPAMSPLVVHWAGISNRSWLMRKYLMRRFGVRPGWFNEGRGASERCAALAPLSPRASDGCSAGAMGSTIVKAYQGWDCQARLDIAMGPASEAEAFAVFDRALQGGPGATPPDRADDRRAMGARFRDDLVQALGGASFTRAMTVVEIGAYLGYTTRFLAERFRAVVALEREPEYVSRARSFLAGLDAAEVLQVDTLVDDWKPVAVAAQKQKGADVVLIDGDHSYESVLNDLNFALLAGLGPRSRRPRFVALDDYPQRAEVGQAVADFVDSGALKVVALLGDNEGALCEVLGGDTSEDE